MKNLFLIFTILLAVSHSKAEQLILSNINSYSWGVTGILENSPGSLNGQKILLLQFDRKIEKKNSKDINIKVSYPQIPVELLNSHLLYQKGQSVSCKVKDNQNILEAFKISQYQTDFQYPSRNISDVDNILGLANNNYDLCSIKITLKNNVNPYTVNWKDLIQIGYKDQAIRLKEQLEHTKPYDTVATAYIDFLNQNNSPIETDDEFLFLLSASIYLEPILLKNFYKLNEAYIQNWIKKLSVYVVSKLNNEQYKSFIKLLLKIKIPEHIDNFYKIESRTEEVVYEM